MLARDGPGEAAAVGGSTVVLAAAVIVGANQTGNTGPILAFSGAVLVALVTWYAADRRQRAALREERNRLTDQHDHERRLADRADLRVALAAVLEADEAIHRHSTSVLRAEVAKPSEGALRVRERSIGGLWNAAERFNAAASGVRIRLGESHGVSQAIDDLDEAQDEMMKASEAGDTSRFDHAIRRRKTAKSKFVQLAVAEAGTDRPVVSPEATPRAARK
jgi:hypothetical protein